MSGGGNHSPETSDPAAGPAAPQARDKALADEVVFWNDVVSTGGWRWCDEHKERLDPTLELHWDTRKFVRAPTGSTVDILDVGAGPLTILGKVWPRRTVRITAVDPLAAHYDELLAANNISPLVRTIAGHSESLVEQFGRDRFDLVFCRNAMDHTEDPLAGIRQCLEVAKPEKYVLLNHFTNEGEYEKYDQLHQWNFDKQDGRFVAWNPRTRVVVDEAVADLCDEIYCEIERPRWIVVALRKRGPGHA